MGRNEKMNEFIPIYKEAYEEAKILTNSIDNVNVGLLYSKFFDQWVRNDDNNKLEINGKAKQSWISKVSNKKIGNGNLIQEMINRRKLMVEAMKMRGYNLIFENTSRFVTGLGIPHPIENGFAWHHILGTPYLPGSSVKGIVKSYCINWLNKPIDDKDIKRIFGGTDTSNEDGVGSVIFLDAIPYHPVELEGDVITPHYNKYYADAKKNPPGDWDNPTPIPFLVVKKGQEFMFSIISRKTGDEDVEKVKEWLIKALDEMGGGAKTALGYGRFKQKEEKSQGSNWLERIKMNDKNLDISESKNIGPIVKKLLEEGNDIELKRSVAEEIKNRYPSRWSKPSGKSTIEAIKKLKEILNEQ